jgi:predicted FMN-binding regulatory protein PaiB
MKNGIVAFAIAVTRLDVKVKATQNRSAADRAGVLRAMQGGDERARALGEWMQRLGPAG